MSRKSYLTAAVRLKWVLKLCSMVLSGAFGYLQAEGVPGLNIVLPIFYMGIAYGYAWATEQGTISAILGDRLVAQLLFVMAACAGLFTAIADYSSSTAVREIVLTGIGDKNRVTNDKIGEIKRIEGRQAAILADPVMSEFLEAPNAYKARINNLNGNATIMKRSNNCQNQTVADTKDHCKQLEAAQAGLAKAEKRELQQAQLKKLDEALVAAKEATAGITTHANATAAATKAFVSWGVFDLNPNASNMAWGQNGMFLFSTIAMVVLIGTLSMFIGTVHGREQLREDGVVVDYAAPRLAGPADAREAIPLTPAPNHTVIVAGRDQPARPEIDQLMALAAQALAQFRSQSPFAQSEGKA